MESVVRRMQKEKAARKSTKIEITWNHKRGLYEMHRVRKAGKEIIDVMTATAKDLIDVHNWIEQNNVCRFKKIRYRTC